MSSNLSLLSRKRWPRTCTSWETIVKGASAVRVGRLRLTENVGRGRGRGGDGAGGGGAGGGAGSDGAPSNALVTVRPEQSRRR